MDYKLINAAACFVSLVFYLIYLRSGKYVELRSSLFLIALFLLYFGGIYATSILLGWDTANLSAWLRPPFSVYCLAISFLLVEIVWGDRIYPFLHKIIRKVK